MTEFAVDTATLQALADRLKGIAAGLGNTDATVRGFDDAIGSPTLTSALHTFVSEWSDGMEKITKNVATVVSYLGGAATSYRTFDADLAASFRDAAGP